MSILIDKNTRVLTQGITGKTGMFHTKMGKEYANGAQCYVAGVTPKKGGQKYEGIPIFETVKEVNLSVPLVVRMKGTNEDLGKKLLAESGLPIISANNMAEAAERVVAAAKK